MHIWRVYNRVEGLNKGYEGVHDSLEGVHNKVVRMYTLVRGCEQELRVISAIVRG